ncbi:MAG: hypothetical protein JXB07_14690 [Anaerolineae bacterium]|nr:hypothetical protein [Anaerolineae bacterium]
MRLLHDLQPDEKPVSQGIYHYLKDDVPTGQVEKWLITHLPNGTEIIRADVGDSESSLLTHLRRQLDGKPEWLRLRYGTHSGVKAAAQYTFEEAVVRVARQAEGQPQRLDVVDIAISYQIDYHPVISHDYVWRGYPTHARGKPWSIPVFSPDLWTEGPEALFGRALRFNVKPLGAEDIVTPVGKFEAVRSFEIILDDGTRALAWFDDFGIPLRWFYPDKAYDFVLAEYKRQD